MSLSEFVERVDSGEYALTVLNREATDPLIRLLRRLFDSDSVDVREGGAAPAGPPDLVQLVDGEGSPVATARLERLRDGLLLVNSDLYTTGARPLEAVEASDVVTSLAETKFTVRDGEKLLLVHLSRYVEAMALETDDGTLHAGFQRLSRLRDERGTERAYRRLAASDVDVHVYGVRDWDGPPARDISVHAGREELEGAWFVVHDGAGQNARTGAVLCIETDDGSYDGFWTFRAELVEDLVAYLDSTYL